MSRIKIQIRTFVLPIRILKDRNTCYLPSERAFLGFGHPFFCLGGEKSEAVAWGASGVVTDKNVRASIASLRSSGGIWGGLIGI